MPDRERDDQSGPLAEFRKALADCENLYITCAQECARTNPDAVQGSRRDFLQRMVDLSHALMLRIFVEVGYVDQRWSAESLELAEELFLHVWSKRLNRRQLKEALAHFMDQEGMRWDTLLGPFVRLAAFRRRRDQLQTTVMRVANLIAKADGHILPEEVRQLQWIQSEMRRVLVPIPVAGGDEDDEEPLTAGQQELQEADPDIRLRVDDSEPTPPAAAPEPASAEQLLEAGLAELDGLIGLDNIKSEVRGLINFLKMQQARQQFGLPQTPISLHAVFSGNPGTGKTTVARLFGRLLGAMGILARGHLVETDRSGLVASYAGQTAPKSHKKIDEALGGVLFVDEAYSLVAETGDDPYGTEALQVLLKRMEDDRRRLVVILAGYPQQMLHLLKVNPGLSSRFTRHFVFPDYSAGELGQIFDVMRKANRYELPQLTRVKLLLGFQQLLDHRDERFGNGRLVRNVFEQAIGRLANRIAGVAPLTRELLTTLEAEDVVMDEVPASVWHDLDSATRHFRIICPGCRHVSRLPQKMLGHKVVCKHCKVGFSADWGEVMKEE